MTVKELAESLDYKIITGGKGLENEVTGCYCGDLLSWVMAKAQGGDAWLTVMGNVNSIAVATLTDCACIILTELAPLDTDARLKAESHGIAILTTHKNSCEGAVEICSLLKNKS